MCLYGHWSCSGSDCRMPGRGTLRGTPAASPITLTAQPRSLPRTAAVVPPLAMAHAADARTGAGPGRSTCLSITLLALAADCCVSSPHLPLPTWCRDLAGAAFRRLAAHSQEYPPRARPRWPSLWCWSTACTIFCGSFSTPLVDSGDR